MVTGVLSLSSYSRTAESISLSPRQLTSCIQVAGVAKADRHSHLNLHLKRGASTFFDQLLRASREYYDDAITALRSRYINDQRVQLQKLVFQLRKMKTSDEIVKTISQNYNAKPWKPTRI